mgnify:CR=1 FL=1
MEKSNTFKIGKKVVFFLMKQNLEKFGDNLNKTVFFIKKMIQNV